MKVYTYKPIKNNEKYAFCFHSRCINPLIRKNISTCFFNIHDIINLSLLPSSDNVNDGRSNSQNVTSLNTLVHDVTNFIIIL